MRTSSLFPRKPSFLYWSSSKRSCLPLLFSMMLLASLFLACSKDDDSAPYGNEKDGYAINNASGHSFQFFNSKKWIFSVAVNNGEINVSFPSPNIADKQPTFDYKRTGKNDAECWVSLPFKYTISSKTFYNLYNGHLKLHFTSPQNGTFENYSIATNKLSAKGTFTLDKTSF